LPDHSLHRRTALAAVVVIAAYLGLATFADLIAPRDPLKTTSATLQPPSREFLFGTDDLGRDLFSGVVHGVRTALTIGVTVAFLSGLLGLMIGLTAGFCGGWVDDLLMRLTELFLTPPRFFLALTLAALFGSSLSNLILILSLTFWPLTARVMRAETASLREREFILAARAVGASGCRILRRELLPHLIPLFITSAMVRVGNVILVEAGLEFLGLGDLSRVSWGTNLYWAGNNAGLLTGAWWTFVPAGACIALVAFAFALFNYAVDEITNPRLRAQRETANALKILKRQSVRVASSRATPVVRPVQAKEQTAG